MPKLRFLTTLLGAILLSGILRAQDNHYEYLKTGSRNSIIANAGLSRFEDQAAVIVNPATLSYAMGSSFSLNTTAVGFSNITFRNDKGQGFNINYGNLNVLPNMAVGVLKPKKNEKDWVMGYGVYHRMNDKLRFTDRQESKIDVLDDSESPGLETYIAQYNLAHQIDEISAIIGAGWNISEHVAIGFSQIFTYRTEEYQEVFSASALPPRGGGATIEPVSGMSDFYARYYKIFTQTKLGMAIQLPKWDIGLTFGLPSVGIMGTGEVMSEAILNNIRLMDDLNRPRSSYFANGRADEIKPKYKYGLSAGLGVSRAFGKLRLYTAVNWYEGLKAYTVLDPGDVGFFQPVTDSNVLYTDDFLRVYAKSKSVVNASIGADWSYHGTKHLLFSFHKDGHFAQQDDAEQGKQLAVKRWDNYHIAIGTQQTFFRSDWMIGFRYSFAKVNNAPEPYSFEDPTERNFLRGDRQTGVLKATSFQFMLSYSFKIGVSPDAIKQ